MTSDGISSEDWDRVHELALNIANAPESDERDCYDEMFAFLAQLRLKYGERASLLATEADYVDDPREAEQLFLKAFHIAIADGDTKNICEIALSLANLHISARKDAPSASRWLEIASSNIPADDEMSRREYDHIQQEIDRLKHSG